MIAGGLLAGADPMCQAQTTPIPNPACKDFVKKAKHPTDWLTWGGDLRIRNDYLETAFSLTDDDPYSELNFARFRGRLWTTLTPVHNLALNVRLSAEPRLWTKPAGFGPYGPSATTTTPKQSLEWRYGIFDLLNLQWRHISDQPLTLVVGRQEILLGEANDWWLVADGTPGDGSFTFFLDAVRLTYDARNIKTQLDLIYLHQNAAADAWFPTMGKPSYADKPRFPGTDYSLTEQNEQGVVISAANQSLPNTTLAGYWIYKRDARATFARRGVEQRSGANADIYTLGGRITGTPADQWVYSLEAAYQLGRKQERMTLPVERDDWRDINAYGGKARLGYRFIDPLNHEVSLVGEYLSGDDPATDADEMFDVLWGRWPRWSEPYSYAFALETGGKFAQMNNVARVGPGWTIRPVPGLTFSAIYHALFAPEATPTRTVAASRFRGDDHFRGHHLQTILKHQFNGHVVAHLWGEFIWQGDYYAQRDLMTFLRIEVMFTW